MARLLAVAALSLAGCAPAIAVLLVPERNEESRAAFDAGGSVDARKNSSRPKWYSERVGYVLVDLSRFGDSLGVPRPRLDGPVRG
jgi:hypothetical protein